MRREVPPAERARVALVGLRRRASRLAIALSVVVAFFALDGCDRPPSRARDDSAIKAAVEKARLEDEEADRRLRERAIAAELDRRDAEQAELDRRAGEEEARQATIVRLEERLRGVLIDPASMQVRNARLTADGSTLCVEVNARNKQGIYLGFHRAVVSDVVVSMDQDPDDLYREPQQRFAAIAKVTGCDWR